MRLAGFLLLILMLLPPVFGQQALSMRPSLTMIKRSGIFPLRTKPDREQRKRMQPDPLDLERYETFLQAPRTGIFRLLPDLGCFENVHILKVDDICRKSIPESSFYSFREREHTLEVLSDIRLKGGFLISDGILSQGMMVNLGDVALESVSLETEGLGFINGFTPDPSALRAKDQYAQISNGIRSGRHEYRKTLPVVANSTYALRVVAYRGNVIRSFRGYRYDLLEGDKRIDLTIAFRVVRKDPDGSVTLIWKELERRESPRIKFQKKRVGG